MADSLLNNELMLQAINVARELNVKYAETAKKMSLMDDENKLYLQILMKKIPRLKTIKLIKIPLPHSILNNTPEVCLIAGDLDTKNRKAAIEPDILHYKELLEEKGVANISEVMTLRQLRTEYKPYEAKQKLLAAFDVFLADNRICRFLPTILGRHFFRKRKYPVQVNLRSANLKERVKKILSTSVLNITGQGNSCICEIASLSMNDSEIVDNIVSAGQTIFKKLPGSWDNVMGIYLKTAKSKGVPIYMSFDDPNSVTIDDEKRKNEFYVDELSTVPNVRVKVFSDFRVETVRTRDDFRPKKHNPDQNSEPSSDGPSTQDSVEKSEIKDEEEKEKLADKSKIISEFSDTVSTFDLKSEVTPKDGKKKKRKSLRSLTVESEINQDGVENSEIEEGKKNRKSAKDLDTIATFDLKSESEATPKDGKKRRRRTTVAEIGAWDSVEKAEISDTVSTTELKSEETPKDAKKKRKSLRSLAVEGSLDSVEKAEESDIIFIDELKSEETPKDTKKKRRSLKSLAVEGMTSQDSVEKSEIGDEKEKRKLTKRASFICEETMDITLSPESKSYKTPKDGKKKRVLSIEDSDIKILSSIKKLMDQKVESVNNSPCSTPTSVSKRRKRKSLCV